jgi:hypothetical protein
MKLLMHRCTAMTNVFKIDFDELWNQLEEEQSMNNLNLSLSKTIIGNNDGRAINSSQDRTGIKANDAETMGMKLEGSHQRGCEMEFSESSFPAELLIKTDEQRPCTSVASSTHAYSSSGSGIFIPGITGPARCLGGSSSEFSNCSASAPSGSRYFIPGITGTARCLDDSRSHSSLDIPSTPRRQWQGSGSISSLETTPTTSRRRVTLLSQAVLSDQEHIKLCAKSSSTAHERIFKSIERPVGLWEKNSSEHLKRLHTSPVAQNDVVLLMAESAERERKVNDLFVDLEQRMRELERREKKLKKKKARLRRELGK